MNWPARRFDGFISTVPVALSPIHEVLIVGAGIGGLSAALALARRNIVVTVLEQSAQLSQIGAGIQLSPNATRVLDAWGLSDVLASNASSPQANLIRDFRSGRVLAHQTLGPAVSDRYGFNYYQLHRADLIQILQQALLERPSAQLRLGARVEQVSSLGMQAVATVAGETLTSDLLIGADGIHSQVRASLFGDDQARFTGHVAWRALVPADNLPATMREPVTTVWMGPGRHFVHYPIANSQWINCVGVVEKDNWQQESWQTPAANNELRKDFAGWHDDLQQLIQAVEPNSCFQWALYDRPPMTQWSRQNVTLLGDACHPILPFMAQGAAMAIEDAAVLDRCLQQYPSLAEALNNYQAKRQARTRRMRIVSRRNGQIFHCRGPIAWLRNQVLGPAATRAAHRVYDYNALQ